MKNKQITVGAARSEWKGYSLEELRYARVITLTRIEIEKSKLIDATAATRESLPFVGSSPAGAIFKSISKFEYFIIAFKLFRKIAPLFKKKK